MMKKIMKVRVIRGGKGYVKKAMNKLKLLKKEAKNVPTKENRAKVER
jgi:hypothetical protein